MTRDVAEMCPHCMGAVEMLWDVEQLGYKAYCPLCGKRLMLCDACQHDEDGAYIGGCDYDRTTDSCKHNRVEVEADG